MNEVRVEDILDVFKLWSQSCHVPRNRKYPHLCCVVGTRYFVLDCWVVLGPLENWRSYHALLSLVVLIDGHHLFGKIKARHHRCVFRLEVEVVLGFSHAATYGTLIVQIYLVSLNLCATHW